MDVIFDQANNICNKFVLTWDDNSNIVHAVYGDLNHATTGTPVTISAISGGMSPDIAGIQRTVGLGVDDIALITFTNPAGTMLYYRECDFTAGPSLSGVTTLDNGSTSNSISLPRIDALDDFNVNNGTNANYAVVAQVDNSGILEVREYDNTASNVPSNGDDISGFFGYGSATPPYNHYAPTVSVGSDGSGGYNYGVLHYLNYGAVSGDVLYMEPLPYSNTASFYLSKVYWVNSNNLTTTDGGTCNHASATCSAPNNLSLPSVFAWASFDGIVTYEVHLKLSSTATYGFKHAQNNSSGTSKSATQWSLSPNPATDAITVGRSDGIRVPATYRITDVTGRLALSGTVTPSNKTIDTRALNPGTYFIKIINDNADDGNMIFVKQ